MEPPDLASVVAVAIIEWEAIAGRDSGASTSAEHIGLRVQAAYEQQPGRSLPERVLIVNRELVDQRNTLRELVDDLWGELPVDIVLDLAERSPELVEACRANHELVAHS